MPAPFIRTTAEGSVIVPLFVTCTIRPSRWFNGRSNPRSACGGGGSGSDCKDSMNRVSNRVEQCGVELLTLTIHSPYISCWHLTMASHHTSHNGRSYYGGCVTLTITMTTTATHSPYIATSLYLSAPLSTSLYLSLPL